jgi:hypothetical protein
MVATGFAGRQLLGVNIAERFGRPIGVQDRGAAEPMTAFRRSLLDLTL